MSEDLRRKIDERKASKLIGIAGKNILNFGKDLVKLGLIALIFGGLGWIANDLCRSMKKPKSYYRPEIAFLYEGDRPNAEIIIDPHIMMRRYPLIEEKGLKKFGSERLFVRPYYDPNDYEKIKKALKDTRGTLFPSKR